MILGAYGQIDDEKFLDPRSNLVLTVDHMHLTVSDAQPAGENAPKISEAIASLRCTLDTHVAQYTANFYPAGVSTVWATPEGLLVIAIVDNKYHPDSFW